MSLASDRPPASSAQLSRPYSVLPSNKRSQTGPRPKNIADSGISGEHALTDLEARGNLGAQGDLDAQAEPGAQAGAHRAQAALPLSLVPPMPASSRSGGAEPSAEAPPPSSMMAQRAADEFRTETTRVTKTPTSRSYGKLGTCPKHNLTLSRTRECLLCKKEAKQQAGGSSNQRLALAASVTLLLALVGYLASSL